MDKNESTMPPLPGHPEPFAIAWTELELREIEEYGVACWDAGHAAAPTEIPAHAETEHAQAALSDEQIIEIATTTRSAEANKDGGYILPISFARAILSVSQQPAAAPAEQAQGQAVEQGDDELPPLPECDVIAYSCIGENDAYSANRMREYGRLCLAQRTGSAKPAFDMRNNPQAWAKVGDNTFVSQTQHPTMADCIAAAEPSEQAEAQGKPATTEGCAGFQGKPVADCGPCAGQGCDGPAVTVDTPEFRDLLITFQEACHDGPRDYDTPEMAAARNALLAHTARAVAQALEGQLTELGPGGALYQPQDILIEGRTPSGHTIDLEIFGDGTKNGKQLFIVTLPAPPDAAQPSQPAGAVQEPVAWGNLKVETGAVVPYRTHDQAKASVDNSYVGCPQEGPYKVIGLYTAPPAAVQSTQELRNALTELATAQQMLIDANAEITALNLAASAQQPDSERDAALTDAARDIRLSGLLGGKG